MIMEDFREYNYAIFICIYEFGSDVISMNL